MLYGIVLRQSRRHCCASLAAHTRHFGRDGFVPCMEVVTMPRGLNNQPYHIQIPFDIFYLCPTGVSYLYKMVSCSTKVIGYSESATVARLIQAFFVLSFRGWRIHPSHCCAQGARALEALLARPDTKAVEGQGMGHSQMIRHGLISSPSPQTAGVSASRDIGEKLSEICPFKHVQTQ